MFQILLNMSSVNMVNFLLLIMSNQVLEVDVKYMIHEYSMAAWVA